MGSYLLVMNGPSPHAISNVRDVILCFHSGCVGSISMLFSAASIMCLTVGSGVKTSAFFLVRLVCSSFALSQRLLIWSLHSVIHSGVIWSASLIGVPSGLVYPCVAILMLVVVVLPFLSLVFCVVSNVR